MKPTPDHTNGAGLALAERPSAASSDPAASSPGRLLRVGSVLRRTLALTLLTLLGSWAASPVAGEEPPLPDALGGPWRWIEPNPGALRAAGVGPSSLEGPGPWREPAITRDPDRRRRAIVQLASRLAERERAQGFGPGETGAPRSIGQAALESARLLEAANAPGAAAEAYAAVIEAAGGALVDVWHGLAANHARRGDALSAELAFLRGLDASGRASDQIRFRYDLAGFYASQGRSSESLAVIDALAPHTPESVSLDRARRGLGTALEIAAFASPRGPAPNWPSPPSVEAEEPGWEVFGPRVARLADRLPESVQDGLLPVAQILAAEERLRLVLFVGVALLIGLAVWVLLRQRGDLAVTIEYPEELRGVFLVRVRDGRRAPPEPASEAQIRKGGASSRREHHLVARETQFQRLFTGRYHVVVDGLLLDPESEEILGRIREEKIVRVRHRRTVRIEFDAHPMTSPVDLRVVWGDRAADETRVTVPGFIDKPRAANAGKIRLLLPKGEYRLRVGCGDRVFDQPLSVESFRPSTLEVDVLNAEAVFKGCPPAVDPYLTGDLTAVARALERDGQAELGFRLLATQHKAAGDAGRAADFFESANDPRSAAELRLEQGDLTRAAALFEQAEDWIAAAEAHERDGRELRAGECFERGLDYERAIACYRAAGAIDRWLTALERYGEVFPAAKLALEHNQRPRAIRLLQRVEPNDPDFREACALLAEAFETEGHYDLAAAKLDEHIATFRPDYATADTYSRLAELWEQAGHFERALGVLEDLRRREPTFPNIAARIEVLRKHRSASGHLYSPSQSGRSSDGGATAFVGDVRYDLLEEIGRGGMGVVYRARDTRLDRIVALKRLPEGLRRHHPRALQFFLREAQSAARLNHPNIVTVYDADQQGGQFFITMELLEGQPLQTILHERGQLSPSNLLGIARQACRGLDYAHGQGVIHRDIKTANLFVTTERVVKIMDFGLAKVLEEVRGATTMVTGTPYYMSPEQVLGRDVDHRTDLYSLGVTLFELATGVVPFDSGEVGYHHRHSPVPDPQSLRPDLSDALSALILRLLEKEPDDRVQTASDMLRILTEIDPD